MATKHIPDYKPTGFADRRGPRMNYRKFRHKIVTKELYKKWKVLNPSLDLTFDGFKRIWKLVALELQYSVIEDTEGVLLPHGIGDIYLGWVKPRAKPIDYKLSRELDTIIYHDNYHSYGKIGKIIYSPCGRYQLRHCDMWSFTPITPFRERSVKAFNEYPERYKNSRQKNYYGHSGNRTINITDTQSS